MQKFKRVSKYKINLHDGILEDIKLMTDRNNVLFTGLQITLFGKVGVILRVEEKSRFVLQPWL